MKLEFSTRIIFVLICLHKSLIIEKMTFKSSHNFTNISDTISTFSSLNRFVLILKTPQNRNQNIVCTIRVRIHTRRFKDWHYSLTVDIDPKQKPIESSGRANLSEYHSRSWLRSFENGAP